MHGYGIFPAMRIVDAHIHLWTGQTAPPHHSQVPLSVERAIAGMDQAGITAAINCPPLWDPQAIDYAAAAAASYHDRVATLSWFAVENPADMASVDALLSCPGTLGLRLLFASPAAIEALLSDRLDWLWSFANERDLPVAFGVAPAFLERVGSLAAKHPRLRVMVDHLAVSPFEKLPGAAAHFEMLLGLAQHPNVAIKASAVPSMSTLDYPFADTRGHLRRFFDAFGASRMFWGTDITRMQPSWRQCVQLFTEELPWLKGRDLELVMGEAIVQWVNWAGVRH